MIYFVSSFLEKFESTEKHLLIMIPTTLNNLLTLCWWKIREYRQRFSKDRVWSSPSTSMSTIGWAVVNLGLILKRLITCIEFFCSNVNNCSTMEKGMILQILITVVNYIKFEIDFQILLALKSMFWLLGLFVYWRLWGIHVSYDFVHFSIWFSSLIV